jgi:predicted HTH domain antitoxin
MTPEKIALTLDFTGKILLGIMALMVHWKIKQDKRIDKEVIKEIKIELTLGSIAILLFIIEYWIRIRL